MGGVLCHGQRPSLLWKDVHGGVIRYNALLDDASQQHVRGVLSPPRGGRGRVPPRLDLRCPAAAEARVAWVSAAPPRRPQAWQDTIGNDIVRTHRLAPRGVLGANDGIVSTASLVQDGCDPGDAQHCRGRGVAGLVAGAMSMAAGEYVSVQSQADTEQG